MTEKTVIYNNPLDGRMERYSGMAVTPDMVMEYLEYDIVKADEYLRNWAERHADECDILGTNPLRIKVMLMPHDIDRYNRNIMNNKRKARRIRR